MTQPDSVAELATQIRADVDAVWVAILAEQSALLAEWVGLTPPERLHRLTLFQAQIRTLADQADAIAAQYLTAALTTAYETGAWVTAVTASSVATFTATDTAVIAALARDTMTDLLRATDGVRESVKVLVRTLARDHIRIKLYTGLTAEQAGVRLAADLAQHGIHAVQYSNGRRVGLTTYTDMVVRTKTAEAYQEGGFQQGEDLGIDWWEIFDGHDCGLTTHEDPQKANGMIVHTDVARANPLSHPNCRRSTSPRPDVSSAREAAAAKPSTTEAQRENQRQAELARAEGLARTPRRVSLDAQARRRLAKNQDLAADTVPPAARRHETALSRHERLTRPSA